MKSPAIKDVWCDQCLVSWEPPDFIGKSEITAYYLKRTLVDKEFWTTVASFKYPDLACTFLDRGLEKGNQYLYSIFAENRSGFGPASDPSKVVIAEDPLCMYFTCNCSVLKRLSCKSFVQC